MHAHLGTTRRREYVCVMKVNRLPGQLRLLLVAALLMGLSALGAAHDLRPAASSGIDAQSDVALAAFLDAGGSLDDLCADGPGHSADHGPCEACIVTATALSPRGEPSAAKPMVEIAASVLPTVARTGPAAMLGGPAGPRAPPVT